MKKKTPREEINQMIVLNGNEGFYGTHYQFIILIENRLYQKATKIMKDLNDGFLWSDERLFHNKIQDYLLDGISVKEIKNKFKKGEIF